MLGLEQVLLITLPGHNVLLILIFLQSSLANNRGKQVLMSLRAQCISFMATTSRNGYSSTHLLHGKPAAFCGLPLHLSWIDWLHWLHLILFEPITPFLQSSRGYFHKSSIGPNLASHFISFVLPMFTLSPFSLSISNFWIFFTSSSSVSAIKLIVTCTSYI